MTVGLVGTEIGRIASGMAVVVEGAGAVAVVVGGA